MQELWHDYNDAYDAISTAICAEDRNTDQCKKKLLRTFGIDPEQLRP